jgi:hypothetical protein
VVAELFTGGGIIFAHMEADEVLLAKNELQEAFLPTDAANDSMWHSVLLQCRVLKFRETHNQLDESSEDDEDEDEMDEEEEEEDDDDDDEVALPAQVYLLKSVFCNVGIVRSFRFARVYLQCTSVVQLRQFEFKYFIETR